jgi:hypothetical protein
MLFRFFIVEFLFIFLMVAHFVGINSEAAGFACRHEFAALLEEIYSSAAVIPSAEQVQKRSSAPKRPTMASMSCCFVV